MISSFMIRYRLHWASSLNKDEFREFYQNIRKYINIIILRKKEKMIDYILKSDYEVGILSLSVARMEAKYSFEGWVAIVVDPQNGTEKAPIISELAKHFEIAAELLRPM